MGDTEPIAVMIVVIMSELDVPEPDAEPELWTVQPTAETVDMDVQITVCQKCNMYTTPTRCQCISTSTTRRTRPSTRLYRSTPMRLCTISPIMCSTLTICIRSNTTPAH